MCPEYASYLFRSSRTQIQPCDHYCHNRYLIIHIAFLHQLQKNLVRNDIQQRIAVLTEQLSSRTTAPPSSSRSPPPACLALNLAANCASIPLCNTSASYSSSPRKPRAPLPKANLHGPHPHKGTLATYRDERVPHPTLSLSIVLARDLIALVHALAAWEAFVGFGVGSGGLGTRSSAGEGRVA